MLYKDIYNAALSHIGEPEHNASTADYAERAPKLLTSVNAVLFNEYVRFTERGAGMTSPAFCASLDNTFPYDEIMFSPASMLLGAKLVADSKPQLSAALTSEAYRLLEGFKTEFCKIGSTVEVYSD